MHQGLVLRAVMSSPNIKLWYFDFKGRAECTRLLLALTGHKFEDIRFSTADWPKYKPEAPYGQAPFIEIDGEKHAQTMPIMQFLARENGLYGNSNMEAFTIDKVVHLINDIVPIGGRALHEKDPVKKAEVVKEIRGKTMPKLLGHLEEILKQSGTGFVVGNQLTLGDLAIYDLCNSYMTAIMPSVNNNSYPHIAAVVEKVSQNERIQAYLLSRPDTVM